MDGDVDRLRFRRTGRGGTSGIAGAFTLLEGWLRVGLGGIWGGAADDIFENRELPRLNVPDRTRDQLLSVTMN